MRRLAVYIINYGILSLETASLRVAHDAVSVIFFPGDSSITKQNK
jgi:hypothetical protein